MFGALCNTRKSAFSRCFTLPDVVKTCAPGASLSSHSKVFKPETCQWIANVLDWKELFEHRVNRLQHITQHHVFVIGRAANGTIQLVCREWHSSGSWHGSLENSSGVPVFASSSSSQRLEFPLPRMIPSPQAIEQQLVQRIHALLPHLPTDIEKTWFRQFAQPIVPNVSSDSVRPVLSLLAPVAEELLVPPPPPIQRERSADDIRALPPPANPLLYKQRTVLLNDNVVVPNLVPGGPAFAVAKVVRVNATGHLRIRMYARDESTSKYTLPTERARVNEMTVNVKSILLSGFQLTSAGKMYESIRKLADSEVASWKQSGGQLSTVAEVE